MSATGHWLYFKPKERQVYLMLESGRICDLSSSTRVVKGIVPSNVQEGWRDHNALFFRVCDADAQNIIWNWMNGRCGYDEWTADVDHYSDEILEKLQQFTKISTQTP